MNICVVEDDDYKVQDIICILKNVFPDSLVDSFETYRSGSHAVFSKPWDLIVLDMQLPLYPEATDERRYSFAGERILRKIEREGLETPVVMITQYTTFSEYVDEVNFESLVERLRKHCPRSFVGAIQYVYGQTAWRVEFENLLKDENIIS